MGVTLRQNYKEGCDCKMGHRNDIAYHVVTCMWRIRQLSNRVVSVSRNKVVDPSELTVKVTRTW